MGRALATALAVLLVGCSSPPPAPRSARASFVDGGVRVQLDWMQRTGRLTATFTPTRTGFHLYSVDLPVGGVEGLGQRTTVAVSGGLRATGRPRADRAVRWLRIETLHVTLPVYPDGPVTITVPVRRTGGRAVIALSYAACSASLCFVPILRHPATLDV